MLGGPEIIIIGMAVVPVTIVIIYFLYDSLSGSDKKMVHYPPPPCPECGAGMQFVHQYQRLYCEQCKKYR